MKTIQNTGQYLEAIMITSWIAGMVTKLLTTAMGGHSQNYLLADVPCLSPYGNKKKKGGEAPAVFFKRNITDRGIYSIWENKTHNHWMNLEIQLFLLIPSSKASCFIEASHFVEEVQNNGCISITIQCMNTRLSPLCFWGPAHSTESCFVALDRGWRRLR